MYQINIDPVLLNLGFLQIKYYGLVFLLIYYILRRNKEELRLDNRETDSIIIWLFVGMIVGSRVIALLSQDYTVFRDPLALFRIWEGGMSFFGGLVGAVLAGVYVFKKHDVNFYNVANLVVVPVSFVLILGRLTNFINQELVGKVTDVNWCFNFVNYVGCRHPYQLYSGFAHLVLFAVVYLVYEYKRNSTFWSFIFGYGILRFVTEFFRDEPLVFLGITLWQYLSVVLIILGGHYLIKKK